MKKLSILLALMASPAMAASGPFFSLGNTDFVVLIAFIVFIGVLVYFKVPGMLGGMLDKRADGIRRDLDELRIDLHLELGPLTAQILDSEILQDFGKAGIG